MLLLSGITQGEYKIFHNYLKTLNIDVLFILVIVLFAVRFGTLLFTEIKKIQIARNIQTFCTLYMYNIFLKSPMKDIEKESIGKFMISVGDESSRASEVIKNIFSAFITLFSILLYTIMIVYVELKILFLLLAFLLIIAYVFNVLINKSKNNSKELLPVGSYVNSLLADTMNGIRVIKSFGITQFTYEKYKTGLEYYQNLNYRTEYFAALNRFISLVLITCFFALYLVYIYSTKQSINVTYYLTIFFILLRLLSFFGELLHQINKIYIDMNASSNLLRHINEKTNISSEKNAFLLNNIHVIILDNIYFRHNKKDDFIFKNLSLMFRSGKSYSIIGESGTGKSTLVDLILNFKTPILGHISIDGINTQSIAEEALTSKIVYISQESIIFNDTIKNNLSLDKVYSEEEMYEILSLVELQELVDSFEDRLNHLLHYKGTNISGGQKQRLNIARALLRRPDVLILDESINALDSPTRIRIVQNLLIAYKQKIIIFVTHDKDILNLVDEIIDLDKLKASE